jgi:hypothetical protein
MLVSFVTICIYLWSIAKFNGTLVYFWSVVIVSPFWYFCTEKSGNPALYKLAGNYKTGFIRIPESVNLSSKFVEQLLPASQPALTPAKC